jgi:hypothetical protein
MEEKIESNVKTNASTIANTSQMIGRITTFNPPSEQLTTNTTPSKSSESANTSTSENPDEQKSSKTDQITGESTYVKNELNNHETVNTELITKMSTSSLYSNKLLEGGSPLLKDEEDMDVTTSDNEDELLNDKMDGGMRDSNKNSDDEEAEDYTEASIEDGDHEDGSKSLKDQDDIDSSLMQDGGALHVSVHEYKILYLADDDEKLVNPEKIKKTVARYIDNYNSESMKKYKQLFKNVYQKYSNKRYRIDNNEDEIVVVKASATNQKKPEIVFEVNKPGYIFYNKDYGLLKLKQRISNKRQELQLHYQNLVNKLEVTPEEKKQFEKERKNFIDILERFYIFNLYHQKINNITNEGKTNLLIQQPEGFIKENTDRVISLIGNVYSIDNTLIDNINANNANRLNNYNELIAKLKGAKLGAPVHVTNKSSKDDGKETGSKQQASSKEKAKEMQRNKIIEEIKEYLKSRDELNKLQNQISQSIKKQTNYIDYIINKVPNN